MDDDRDLLPWILGGLLIAMVATAIAMRSTARIAPATLQAVSQATHRTAASTIPPASPAAPTPQPSAPPAAPTTQVQAVDPPPAVPAGQIWECRINGQRAFSSSPCGGESSVRQIGPINRMDSTPILQQTRSYDPEPSYPAQYSYPGEPQDSNPGEFADNSYPVLMGVPFQVHRRPDRARRPHGPRARIDADAGSSPAPAAHAAKTR